MATPILGLSVLSAVIGPFGFRFLVIIASRRIGPARFKLSKRVIERFSTGEKPVTFRKCERQGARIDPASEIPFDLQEWLTSILMIQIFNGLLQR